MVKLTLVAARKSLGRTCHCIMAVAETTMRENRLKTSIHPQRNKYLKARNR